MEAIRLVLKEEYWIERSDLRSMALALGRFGDTSASQAFFMASAEAEVTAMKDLVLMAGVLGLTEADLQAYQPMPEAHAYSAYLAQLASQDGRAAIAAGFATNFPAWGQMCGKVRDALLKPPYSLTWQQVQYFTDFAETTPGFDEAATAVIAEGMARGETADGIRSAVQLLQGYEVMFWDAIWAAATL